MRVRHARATADGPVPSSVGGMEAFVLSMVGADRAGLVDALSEVVVEHGGTWDRSQVTELAGLFAGVVLVRVPDDRSQAFRDGLEPLRERGLLDVTVHVVEAEPEHEEGELVRVDVVGGDRPGIVHELSHAVAELGVSIVELETWVESAAMAGSTLFRAQAVVRLPDGVTRDQLTDTLQGLSNDLMVDLHTP